MYEDIIIKDSIIPKWIKIACLIIIISFVIYIPTTQAFLDIIIDALDKISGALNQLEILTVIRDLNQEIRDISVKWDEIKEIQEDIASAYDLGKRWYYFETGITNQRILSNLDKFFGGSTYEDYSKLLNLSFGQEGNIRTNPEYQATMERLMDLYGKPSDNNYQNLDPEQYLLYNQLVAATDNINAAGNMDSYTGNMIAHFEEWQITTQALVGKEYVSSEALLKSLLKFNVNMVDYYKLSIQYMSSQLRYNSAQAIEKYFDRSVIVNNEKRNPSSVGQSSNSYMNYLVGTGESNND